MGPTVSTCTFVSHSSHYKKLVQTTYVGNSKCCNLDEWKRTQIKGRMDGWMDGWMDGMTDERDKLQDKPAVFNVV
jgi:hypothetical protein